MLDTVKKPKLRSEIEERLHCPAHLQTNWQKPACCIDDIIEGNVSENN